MRRARSTTTLVPEVLLLGYRNGFFPMADPDTGRVHWHRPDPRGIIPLDKVHFSRSLRQTLRRNVYRITVDERFAQVISACSERDDTWISDDIIDAYTELHALGHAHSVEAWDGTELVGGLYGVAVGGAFFGESMFSIKSNASKVAFAHLVHRLRERGFRLLDTQYVNDFTESLGATEIPDVLYQFLLADALAREVSFGEGTGLSERG
jgi:leucyl/phenylalanyl-tRNA--protein transferase